VIVIVGRRDMGCMAGIVAAASVVDQLMILAGDWR